jgi:hypothetical protein
MLSPGFQPEINMSATPEAAARTRAFARVIGPFVMIATTIINLRMPELTTAPFLSAFFDNPVIVWMTGAMLLFLGLVVIAFHQYWSSVTAVIISLFGWYLALRGLVLLGAPELYAHASSASMNMLPVIRVGFGLLTLMGIWLTFVGWIKRAADS